MDSNSHSHSHSNSESDIMNEKKSHREEKPEALASPEQKHEQDTKSKRRKKEKGAEAEPNEHPPQVCPKPLVVPTPIPEEPKPNEITLVTTPIPEPKSNEATLPDPKDTPKKRKRERKKKNALNPNAENPELNKKEKEEEEKGEEPNETNAQHLGECPKPPLDIAVATDLEKQKEAEPSAPQPQTGPGGSTTPIGKNKGKPMIGRGRMDEMVENPMIALNHDQNQTQSDPPIPVCPKPLSLIDQTNTVEPALSAPSVLQTIPVHPAIPIDTEQKLSKNQRRRMKRMMRKSVLDGAQPNEHIIEQAETPVQTSICHKETPPIDPGMDPHPVIPICPKPASLIDQTSTVDPALSAPPISLTIPVDPAIPIGTEQKMSRHKRRKMRKRLLDGAQPNEHNIEQPETPVQTSICHTETPPIDPGMDPHPVIPICPKPASLIDQTSTVDPALSAPPISQTIPVDPALPIGTEQKMSRYKRRKMRKRLLDGAQPNEHNIEQPETPVQTSICHTETPPIDPGMDPHPVIPICPKPASLIDQTSTVDPALSAPPISQTIPVDPAIPIGTEQKMSRYKRRKMRKRLLDGSQPNEHNIEQPETPVQTSICHTETPPIDPGMDPHPVIPICPKPASLIDQTSTVDPALSAPPISQTIPVDPAIPIGTEQKMSRYKRRKMRKRLLDGAQPNEHNIEQPEIPVQTSICHTAAPPIDPTIPRDPHPATPMDPEQTTSKKKRKRKRKGDLKSEGGKPNEYNGKPTETPVQKSITPIAAPSTDPTVAIDQTKPVDPATPIDPEQKMTENKSKRRRTSALNSKGSESDGHNADSTAEAPFQGTKEVTVTKAHTDEHRQRYKICWACRRTDHKMGSCQMLKSLSKDEEICFFCGEIGHSLGRCSLSLAGGGRFATCLLCNAKGHFAYNCPGDGHGNYVKVVAADGPINKSTSSLQKI